MATAQSWLARKTKNAVAESAIRGGDTTDAKRWPCASIDLQIALREPFADSRHSMLMTSAKCYHLRVCPKTSGGITKFSEHEAD